MTVSFCNSRKMSYTVENNNIVFEYISSQAVRPCVGDESKNMLAALDSVFNFYISGSTLNLYGADSSKVVFVLTRVMPAAQAGINGAWQSLINPSSESSIVYINATSISTCCGAYLARYLITNNNKIAITTIINNSKCLSPDTLNAIASARNVRTKDNNNILMLYNSSYDLVFMGQHVGDIASDQSLDIYIPSATIIPPEMVGTAIDPNNIKQIVQRYLTASQQSTAELANDPRQVRQLVKELVSNLDGHANWDNVKLVSIVNQIVTNLTGEVYMDIVKMPVRDSTAAPIAKAATTQPKSE